MSILEARVHLRPAIRMLVLWSLILGLAYPLGITGLAQMLFPSQANGSLVHVDGQIRGSKGIGQAFDDPRYFWGRPSWTEPFPYNPLPSAGANTGPLHPMLEARVRARIQALRDADPYASGPIPVDLVTPSVSGLDPHISVAAALYQIPRVARARGLPESLLRSLVEQHIEDRTWGILGEPRVNVLLLNLSLDEKFGRPASEGGAK